MGYSSNRRPFNEKQMIHGLVGLLIITSCCIHLFYVADTIQKYAESIFITSVAICIFISFVSTVDKTVTIFVMIEKAATILNEST